MKVKCRQDRKAAIAAGIEPSATGQLEVDVDLSALTQGQRTELAARATGGYLEVVRGDQAEVAARLDDLITARAQEDRADAERRAKYDAAAEEWLRTVTIAPSNPKSVYGVPVAQWHAPRNGTYGCSEAVSEKIRVKNQELDAEIARLETEAMAAAQPAIDATQAEMKAKSEATAAEKEEKQKAVWRSRLETGIYEVECSRGDRSEWGEPWIAKVTTRNGKRPEYDFSAGEYDLATKTLRISCAPGEVIAYGQKNYRKPKKTIHEVKRMREDGAMVSA